MNHRVNCRYTHSPFFSDVIACRHSVTLLNCVFSADVFQIRVSWKMSQNSSQMGRRVFRKRLQEGTQLRSRKETVVHALKEHNPVARIYLVIGFCCLYTMEFNHNKIFSLMRVGFPYMER
jgi:hypothetical protein